MSANAESGPSISLESPESAATEETTLDDVLEDVLESDAQNPSEYMEYIATRMPSRQAQRIGYNYVTLRQRTLGRLKRKSSSSSSSRRRTTIRLDPEVAAEQGIRPSETDAGDDLLPVPSAPEEEMDEDDELDEWEQLTQIRCMIAPMAKKREEWT